MATTSKEGSRRANYPILTQGGSDNKYQYRAFTLCNWNENNVKNLSRTNWRASLVPAAAVIPAPIAYIEVVAVKKLVVGFLVSSLFQFWGDLFSFTLRGGGASRGAVTWYHPLGDGTCPLLGVCFWTRDLYFEKIRVFKAGLRLNTLAWNNRIGLWFCFVGL